MTRISLKQKAYEYILQQVLGGGFEPGTLLNRRGVADALRMSPAPVHEAMLQLESDGFLEALPRVGTRVRAASREDVRGHLVVREALECQAARLVCGPRLAVDRERLVRLADAVDAVDVPDRQRAQSEVEFHVALVELADCPVLLREYRRVMQIGLFYRINLLLSMPFHPPLKRHRELLETLASAAPDRAEACMREHVWSGKPDLL